MGASSKSNASAQKNTGPQGSESPGKGSQPCQLSGIKAPKAQTVTPQIAVAHPMRQFHGLAAPERDELGSFTLKADKSGDKLGYKEAGYLRADNTSCTFYSDARCTKQIDPAKAPVKYKFGSLEKGVTVYYKGTQPGTAQLTLTLDAAKDPRIAVSAAATGAVQAQQVLNTVTPELVIDRNDLPARFPDAAKVDEEIHVFRPEKKATEDDPQVVAVSLAYKATVSADVYDKGGVFTVGGVKATLWRDAKCKVPVAAEGGSLNVTNQELKAGLKLYMRREDAGTVDLALTLVDTTKDRADVATAPVTRAVTEKAVNRVTPYLKVEHLVVLRDQDLHTEQRKNDSAAGSAAADVAQQVHPDATRIELSAAQTAKLPAYTGKGKLVLTPANAKVFEDEACERPVAADKTYDFDKLIAADPIKLYLRGATAGKFTAELQLDASTDPLIKVDGPAKGEMGCVELKMTLFHYKQADVNKAVEPDVDDVTTYWNALKALSFEQKEMTRAERVGSGRMLHVQKDTSHARAKLIIEHTAAHWPAAAKDYKIIINTADADKKAKTRSGALKLFAVEEEGAEISTLPHELTLTAAAQKKPLWVEGGSKCDAWRGIRVSAGFDRPDGGPAKALKMDADWAAFTVVQIKEVTCKLENEPAKEKFVDGTKVFINLDDKGRVLKSVAGNRKAEVTATLEPALKDVDIYFSVVEHADNFKITALPDTFKQAKISKLKHTLKAVDKTDRKKLLSMSAKTDDTGVAKIETLQAPQLGLMKFKIGAYLLQTPQQARYIDEHADLKKKPPTLSTDWLEVWRRVFYGVIAMKRWSGASYLDRFDEEAMKSKMKDVGLEMERSKDPIEKDYDRALPDTLQWSIDAMGGPAPARTLYLCLINGRGDKGDEDVTLALGAPGGKAASFDLAYRRFRSLTDKPKWLTSCSFKAAGKADVDLAPHVTLTQTEDFKFNLAVDCASIWDAAYAAAHSAALSGGALAPAAHLTASTAADTALGAGAITLELKEADSSSGLSWGEAVVVCMDSREPKHATQDAKGSASHTFLHEIGHYLGLAGKFLPDAANTLNPNFYSELAGEVSARGKGGYGVGAHCDGLADQCIVWYQFKMTLAYCDSCSLFLRARALHTPKINGRATL